MRAFVRMNEWISRYRYRYICRRIPRYILSCKRNIPLAIVFILIFLARTSFPMFSFFLILFILPTVLWIHSVFVNILIAIMFVFLIFLACAILFVKFFPFFLFYSFGSQSWVLRIHTFFVKMYLGVIFSLLWNVPYVHNFSRMLSSRAFRPC